MCLSVSVRPCVRVFVRFGSRRADSFMKCLDRIGSGFARVTRNLFVQPRRLSDAGGYCCRVAATAAAATDRMIFLHFDRCSAVYDGRASRIGRAAFEPTLFMRAERMPLRASDEPAWSYDAE